MGHVPRAVDLALVVDALYDLYTGLRRKGMATELATLIVVVIPVQTVCGGAVVALWEVDSGNLEIILGLPGRVGTKQDAMDGIRLICGSVIG